MIKKKFVNVLRYDFRMISPGNYVTLIFSWKIELRTAILQNINKNYHGRLLSKRVIYHTIHAKCVIFILCNTIIQTYKKWLGFCETALGPFWFDWYFFR